MRPKYHSCNTRNKDGNQNKIIKEKFCVAGGRNSKWLHGQIQPRKLKKFRKRERR